MIELLQKYSLEEILIFSLLLFAAIGGIICGIKKIKSLYNEMTMAILKKKEEEDKAQQKFDQHEERINLIQKDQTELNQKLSDVLDKINLLISSDRDDIKAYITKEHHYFCYEQKWIDDYSMDCLEKRFSHYIAEHGNSFVESLMDELRALPKQPPSIE